MVNQSIRVPLNGFKPFPFGNFDVKVKARSGRSVTDDDNVIFGYDLVEKLGWPVNIFDPFKRVWINKIARYLGATQRIFTFYHIFEC